ncbi:MAG TPA: pseudouridine synthase [Patescibacteria group bacterium]|nr:pseudouridine synthase [Patescibacteria group bacterium]
MERLNKFLANAGICSRRKADEHILAGDVKVNGVRSSELGVRIDSGKDIVEFQNKVVKLNTDFIYYVLNKPKGVVSTSSDENGQKTVIDFVPKVPRVYPVGRLDKDTVGLIILTNDGELTKELTHPSFEHQKSYTAVVKGSKFKVESDFEIVIKKFKNGILIDGKLMTVDSISVKALNLKPLTFNLNLVLHTGHNRQIRKMCAKIGLEVTRLTRIGLAKLRLDKLDLKPGEYKVISRADII